MDTATRKSLNAERLKLVSPSIRVRVIEVLMDMEDEDEQPLIAKDVWRSPARQLELFRQGRSKARWGFHCGTTPEGKPDSLAVDIVDADKAWDAPQYFWLSLGAAALRRGLNWGGYWGLDGNQVAALHTLIQSRPDWPIKIALGWDVAHVEVKGVSIAQAKAGKRPAADSVPQTEPAKPILKLGDKGPEVRTLQSKLGIEVDGNFGYGTQKAVMKFQEKHGLTVDGKVGSKTWAKLGRSMEESKVEDHKDQKLVNQSQKHSSGDAVSSPHSALECCFYCGKPHGANDHCENDDVIFFDESPEVLGKGFNK